MAKVKATHEVINFTKYKLIPLNKLVSAKWNYKKDEPQKLEKLINNLKRNGQVENLIVRLLDTGFYEVVNGNHRLEAFKKLHLEKAICYDLGKVSTQEAKRLAIETNETKFEVDQIKLAENIVDIAGEFTLEDFSQTSPYSVTDLENFAKLTDFNWDQFEKPKEEASVDPSMTQFILKCPKDIQKKFEKKLDELLKQFKTIEKAVK